MKPLFLSDQTKELVPATAVVVHPQPELRGIYTRRLRNEFLAVESCATVEELGELRRVQNPDVVVVGVDSLDARSQRSLRQMRLSHPRAALVTVGAVPAQDRLNFLAAFGSVLHIDPQTSRVGDVASAVRRAALSLLQQ